ncbi:helix-turn-helix domain-containing protein [Paenibacillus gorillae]|uniref:helix-turn-helix domain-containing protein n=1 Tax=Paenibacillus gorillae TaxID=1243662 RepID=UPI0004B80B8A|nr:helix-turn-helix transcriptional regulator [Paenibacillus gorillae]
MKYELGACLLALRLSEARMTAEQLAQLLQYKPERLVDYIDNKRVMPLKTAIAIADTLGCRERDLYELKPY